MSLYRRAAKRDDAEPAVVERLEQMGATVERMSRPCDLLIGWRGQTHLAEVKTPGARATGKVMRATKKYQEDFARTWRGAPVALLRTPEEATAWLLGLKSAPVVERVMDAEALKRRWVDEMEGP